MPILVDGTPTFIIPVFQQTGFIIQYKPFASFYQWTDFIDLTEFDTRITAIEASIPADLIATLTEIVDTLGTQGIAIATAQSTADYAVAAAAAVQSNLDATNTNVTAAQTDATAALAAAAAAQATADAAATSTLLPRRGHFHSDEATYITGSPSRNIDATYPYVAGLYTTTQNAHLEFYVTCRAGSSITINALTQQIASGAIITLYLDGTLFGTQDTYAVATNKAYLIANTTGSISAGDHTIAIKALTKNASSSGYVMFINLVTWRVNP